MEFILIILLAIAAYWVFELRGPGKPSKTVPNTQPEARDRHLKNALQFVQNEHKQLLAKKAETEHWSRKFGSIRISELDALNGIEFENFLAGFFKKQGYEVEMTPSSGDFGADLILSNSETRIAVQAKRYIGNVGVAAIQEVLSGMAYYNCNEAWVVTTAYFTQNAKELGKVSKVKLIGRLELGRLLVEKGH